jgi:hypothetical protein
MTYSDLLKGTKWEFNQSAREIILGWFRKASGKDQGNYFVRQLEDIGFVSDSRSGVDFGNTYESGEAEVVMGGEPY